MNVLSIPVVAIASVTFYVGFYHLLIYLRRWESEYLTFALSCFLIGLYDLFSAGLYNATSVAEGVTWQYAQIVALALGSVTFLWFVDSYTSKVPRWAKLVFSTVYVLTAIVAAFDRSGLVWSDQPAIKIFDLSFGLTITYYEMASGPVVDLISLVGVALFFCFVSAGIRLYRERGRERALPFIFSMAFFFVGVFNDSAVASGLYEFIYLMEYAYLAVVLLMTYSLTQRVVDAAIVQDELARIQALLAAAIDQSPSGIIVADAPDARIRVVNAEALSIRGEEKDYLTGIDVSLHSQRWQTFYPDGTPFVSEDLPLSRAILHGEITKNVEAIIRGEDGKDRWVLTNAAPVRGEEGEIIAGVVVFHNITEQKMAEQALERERDLVARIMETSPVGIVVVDRDGQITFANPRAEKIFALTRDEIDGRTYNAPEWRITDFDGGPFPEEQLPFRRVMGTGNPVWDVRHTIQLPDGDVAYLSINAVPLFDEGSEVDGMVASIEDVTERRHAEEALMASERKFRNIIESTPLGMHMYRLEPDGRLVFIDANPAADEILGVDNRQFIGKAIEEAFPALTEMGVPEKYAQVAATGEPWNADQIFYEENQIVGAFEVHAFQTSPRQMVAAFIDVTERVEAEGEVRRWKRLLENVTDSMPSVLITLDLAGRVLTWNPAAEELTGQSIDEVAGRLVWRVCTSLGRYRKLVDQVLETGRGAHQLRESVRTPDGLVYRDVSVYPLVANGVNGVVLRIDNVTRRVQLEEMMFQSAKMASVGGLAAGVAHEINNPLGAIMQSAQMLHLRLDTQRTLTRRRLVACGVDPAALERYIQERGLLDYVKGIRQTGSRAAKIVTDLLHFSRRSDSKIAPNDLNHLLRQVLDLAEADYDLKKNYDFRDVDLVWDLDSALPPVYCDGQQIQQVVLNLVRNAAQAMAEQSKRDEAYEPQLLLRTRQRGNWGRLEVEDNGPGIPEEIRDRLFKPFFTTKSPQEGTGLGLWLSWSIVVERHKGRMRVERGDQGGARFVIELPLA